MPTPVDNISRLLLTILALDIPIERCSDFSTVLVRDGGEVPLHEWVALADFELLVN